MSYIKPADAARRLRHLLRSGEIGVIIANEGILHGKPIAPKKSGILAAFHTETDEGFIGRTLAGMQQCEVLFPKVSGTVYLTEEQVAVLEACDVQTMLFPLGQPKCKDVECGHESCAHHPAN